MVWSHSALWQYLYGMRYEHIQTEDGSYHIAPTKILTHKLDAKEIPSGFFYLDDAENISAILSSNSGTISKFNRMGKLAGFGDPNLMLFRRGFCHDHDPEAMNPEFFAFAVETGKTTESWAEGLNMYHNPNAKHPVDYRLFPSIAHHFMEDGVIKSIIPEFHPYSCITYNILTRKDKKKEKFHIDE